MNAHVQPAQLAAAGDKTLLALCRRAQKVIAADNAAWDRRSEAEDRYDVQKPAYPIVLGERRLSHADSSSTDLRLALHVHKGNPAPWKAALREQIAKVRAWEAECRQARRACGLTMAVTMCDRLGERMRGLVERIVDTPAKTMKGLAAKADVLRSLYKIEYGDYIGSPAEGFADALLDEVVGFGTVASMPPRPAAPAAEACRA